MSKTDTPPPSPLITSDPARLGGTPCFTGTRVPVQTFFEYLEGGESLDAFIEHFPDVTRRHAEAVLQLTRSRLIAEVSGAAA